jgi:gas vesicle protein
MSERDDFGSFLLGFVIGGLTGAALALLLAPQSGEETRTLIKDKTIELKDKASETIDETYARAEAAAAEARLRAEELAKLARARSEEFQKRGQVILEEQKGKLSEAVDTAKKSVSKVTGSKSEAEKPA